MNHEYRVSRTALIDADIIKWKAAAVCENKDIEAWEIGEILEGYILNWQRVAHADKYLLCLSDPSGTFRHDIYPDYKAHRKGAVKPELLGAAADYLMDHPRAVVRDGLEADDLMGILATNGRVKNPVIVTIDKDLRQIPGWHVNPDKEDFPTYVSEEEGHQLFLTQWLTGDSTDNIPGLPGVGPKKAEKFLAGGDVDEKAILNYYKVYLSDEKYAMNEEDIEEYCLTMARLVRILDTDLWNQDTQTPILWTV